MKEEIFVSGRNIPNVDPFLHTWHWPIPLYLFLGGLAAGILFFAAYFTIIGKEDKVPGAIKLAPMVAPIAIVVGLVALMFDLTHMLYFWRLYTTIRLESPMSWGAWVLMVMTPISFAWAFIHLREVFPNFNWPFKWLYPIEAFLKKYKVWMAWALIPLTIVLGIYTGILLSAFNARPLWNNAILGPLFLTSGLSTGAAMNILFAKSKYERHLFGKIDLGLIIVELFFIIHMVMGYYAGPEAQKEALHLLVGGEFTVMFFVFIIGMGLVFPAILEAFELSGAKVWAAIPALLVLIGGAVLRFLMVDAGQMTRYLY